MINTKLADQKLYTLEIQKGLFTKVLRQSAFEKVERSDLELIQVDATSFFGDGTYTCDVRGELIVPGAIDAHVHSRDPGYTDKEDWQTLTKSAYKGGVVSIIEMPNTFPPTLTRDSVIQKANRADKTRHHSPAAANARQAACRTSRSKHSVTTVS